MAKRPSKYLSRESVDAIRAIYAEGCTGYTALAKQYGVTRSAIGYVVRRETPQKGTQSLPDAQRERHLKHRYGITPEERDALWLKQDGRCAACDVELVHDRSTHLDHCHATGRVRALLCRPCNLTLGQVRESPEHLRKLAAYAETHCIQLELVA